MKRFYILLSAAALCVCMLTINASQVFAQQKMSGGIQSPTHSIPFSKNIGWNHSPNYSRTISSNWLGYWAVADSLASDIGNTTHASWLSAMFDDSSVIVCDPPDCWNPFDHMIANVFDPSSPDMKRVFQYDWLKSDPYWIDSMEIYYSYTRHSAPGIVDTLVVYLWNNAIALDIDTRWYLTGANSYPAVDTVWYAGLTYDSLGIFNGRNQPSPAAMTTFKIPLHASDTANLIKSFTTDHFAVPPGGLVASAFRFKAGYNYNAGDTITKNKNDFWYVSDEPNGSGTLGPYVQNDWNMSFVLPTSVRYNIDDQGWNGYFLPSYAWGESFGSEQHLINYYVTGTFEAGINESHSEAGIKLLQNQPNPANQTTLIKYETISAGVVSIEVRDVTGRLVAKINEGIQSAGKHAAVIDVSKLSNGLYTYSLKINNESLTRRMIVSE